MLVQYWQWHFYARLLLGIELAAGDEERRRFYSATYGTGWKEPDPGGPAGELLQFHFLRFGS